MEEIDGEQRQRPPIAGETGTETAALGRRAVLPLIAMAPCALAAPSLSSSARADGRDEIVVIDGWVLTRHDLRDLG